MQEWFESPEGRHIRLPPGLVEASLENVTASLRRGAGEFWFCVRAENIARAEPIGATVLVIGQTVQRGPFFLTGSFEQFPHDIRRVQLTSEKGEFKAVGTDDGWLCLVPSARTELMRVSWLGPEGEERQSLTSPPLDQTGTIGPTNYVPLR